jgi:hypothetical protein
MIIPAVSLCSFIAFIAGCGGGGGSTTSATPTITWPAPAAVSYGTALSATQLNATSNYPGTFSYSPAAGTILGAGIQSLSATYTPSDPAKVTSATATNSLTVNKATPTINWNTPAPVPFGTALGSTQLNATASIAGTFVYSPAAGAVMNAAGTQMLSVTFTPNDTNDYNSATGSVTLSVNASSATNVTVNINTLANRHQISPFVYGNNRPDDFRDIRRGLHLFKDGAATTPRTITTCCKPAIPLQTGSSRTYGGAGDQVQLITNTQNAGSHALTTMAMMDWVAGEAENSSNRNWSYSVQKFGAQCSVDPNNTDAGNGMKAGGKNGDCTTAVPVTTNAVTTAYYPLVDTASGVPGGDH